jgi:hypothetical protein
MTTANPVRPSMWRTARTLRSLKLRAAALRTGPTTAFPDGSSLRIGEYRVTSSASGVPFSGQMARAFLMPLGVDADGRRCVGGVGAALDVAGRPGRLRPGSSATEAPGRPVGGERSTTR